MSTEEKGRNSKKVGFYAYLGIIALLIGALGSWISIWQTDQQKSVAQENSVAQAKVILQSDLCVDTSEPWCVFAQTIIDHPNEPIAGPPGPPGPKGDKGEKGDPGKDADIDITDFGCQGKNLLLEITTGSEIVTTTAPDACPVNEALN